MIAFLLGLMALVVGEIYVIVQAVHLLGLLPTVALLLLIPFVGMRLMRHEGLAALRRVQEMLANQQMPGVALLDGLLLLIAGVCLAVPGFITDAIGLLLLIPPVRRAAGEGLRRALMRRVGGTTIRRYP